MPAERAYPELALGGGVTLKFVRVFSADRDAERKFRLGDIAGAPDPDNVRSAPKTNESTIASNSDVVVDTPHRVRAVRDRSTLAGLSDAIVGTLPGHELRMTMPYRMAIDSTHRVIVTDPPAHAVHIFDFQQKKYFRIQGGEGKRLQIPKAVAVNREDNIYVTDSALGAVLVYDSRGNFLRSLGEDEGEGSLGEPDSIAIDAKTGHIFVNDGSRRLIFLLDSTGNLLKRFGRSDEARPGFGRRDSEGLQDIALAGDELILADGSVCALRVFDLQGNLKRQIEILGGRCLLRPRPVSLDLDAEGNIYVGDGAFNTVRVYDHEGEFLFAFGRGGSTRGEFNSPTAVRIDPKGPIYVADSRNRRVQVFEIQLPQKRHFPGFLKRFEPKEATSQEKSTAEPNVAGR